MKDRISKFVLLLISILIFLPSYYFFSVNNTEELIFKWFLIYLSVLIFSMSWPDWKLFNFIQSLISIPAGIFFLFGPLVKATYRIFFTILFTFGILTIVLKIIPEYVFGIDLNYNTKAYLVFTFGSIILVLYGENISIFLNRILESNKTSDEVLTQKELMLGIFNQKKIKYTIYFFFFCALMIFSVLNLNNYSLDSMGGMNNVLLQSFASYIAFDRLHANKSYFNLNIRVFAYKYMQLLRGFNVDSKSEVDKKTK